MEAEAAMGLYILISIVVSLIVNIIFYRVVFKKPTRKKANLYGWASSLGVMLLINFGLIFPFTSGISTSSIGGAIAYGILMPFIIAPLCWFIPTTVYSLLRFLMILITKKERDVLTKEVEEAELISMQNGQTLNKENI